MIKELTILADIWSKPNRNGISKLLKKDIPIKRQFEIDDTLFSEFINEKGKVVKKYTQAYDVRNNLTYKVNLPYLEATKFNKGLIITGYLAYLK